MVVYRYYMYTGGVINWVEILLYFGILVPLIIYLMFLLFQSIDIGSNKYINIISRTTFGIYLLHDSAFVRQIIWHSVFQVDKNQYGSPYCFLYAILTISIIFAICSICDLVRIKFAEPQMMKGYDKFKLSVKEHFYANE